MGQIITEINVKITDYSVTTDDNINVTFLEDNSNARTWGPTLTTECGGNVELLSGMMNSEVPFAAHFQHSIPTSIFS